MKGERRGLSPGGGGRRRRPFNRRTSKKALYRDVLSDDESTCFVVETRRKSASKRASVSFKDGPLRISALSDGEVEEELHARWGGSPDISTGLEDDPSLVRPAASTVGEGNGPTFAKIRQPLPLRERSAVLSGSNGTLSSSQPIATQCVPSSAVASNSMPSPKDPVKYFGSKSPPPSSLIDDDRSPSPPTSASPPLQRQKMSRSPTYSPVLQGRRKGDSTGSPPASLLSSSSKRRSNRNMKLGKAKASMSAEANRPRIHLNLVSIKQTSPPPEEGKEKKRALSPLRRFKAPRKNEEKSARKNLQIIAR